MLFCDTFVFILSFVKKVYEYHNLNNIMRMKITRVKFDQNYTYRNNIIPRNIQITFQDPNIALKKAVSKLTR